jgi:hypothetical protein
MGAVEDQGFMSGGAQYFAVPLSDEHAGEDDEGPGQKVGDTGADGHNGFAESHFVGDETTVYEGVLTHFVVDTPLNAVELVLLKRNVGMRDKAAEAVHRCHILYTVINFKFKFDAT